MILSNVSLRAMLDNMEAANTPVIIPRPQDEDIQPNSIDVYINPDDIWMWDSLKATMSNVKAPPKDAWSKVYPYLEDGRLIVILKPQCFYMMSTLELFNIPLDMCAFLHGVSTMARLSFSPHEQAGLLDSGWRGSITGEVSVQAYLELTLAWPGNPNFIPPRLGQVVFHALTEAASPGYRGRYQNDMRATSAKLE